MASGDTKTQNYLDVAAHGARRDLPSDNCCNTRTQNLIVDVAKRIMDVEDEVERLKNNPDVADIVETYADLQSYDTSTLTDKDVIRVLADETHGGASTYYRYSTSTQTFTYIGKSSEPVQLLTSDDTNYNISGDPEDYIALWLLPSGTYSLDPSSGLTVLACVEDNGGTIEPLDAYTDAILITVDNDEIDESSYTAEYTVYTPVGGQYFAVDQDGMLSDKVFPYSTFVGASNSTDGEVGLVPAPTTTDTGKFLNADGNWENPPEMEVLSYGSSSWNDFINAYEGNRIVYCRASSNVNPATGSQTRMAFMAYVSSSTAPTSVEFQYIRSVGTKTASQQCDQVFVYKLTNANGGTWSVETRDVASAVEAGANAESTYSGTTITINPRLYTTTGQNTNGGVTQKLFTDTVGNIESALNAINNGGN